MITSNSVNMKATKDKYEFETYSRAFSLKRTMQELETNFLLVMLVKSQCESQNC